MEKKKAHYPLATIQAIVSAKSVGVFTAAALAGVKNLRLSEEEAVAVVLGLKPGMLHKSMTTHADHAVWQDVYHAHCPNGRTAYVKLTLRATGTVVIQFKEK